MNLIEELGLEKCQAIVDGAPEGATGINWFEDDEYNEYVIVKPEWSEKNKHAYWHNDAMTGTKRWEFMANIFNGYNMLEGLIELNDLRAAIADHNRTDYVSDIHNHISPLTKEIER